MKNYLKCIPFSLLLLFASCGGSEDEVEYNEQQDDAIVELDYDEFSKEVNALETKILKETVPSDSLLRSAVTKFQDFASEWPDDPKSPDYLFKASDYALTLNQPAKSVKILDKILNLYPDYDKREDVLYIKADHLDWELRDTTRAKAAYQEYIDNYPETQRAEDARLRIQFIHLSFEEYAKKIISEYEAQAN
ncbi:MAG: tetratricopeptide repeat protein [Crocinitomicaceae bacterium]